MIRNLGRLNDTAPILSLAIVFVLTFLLQHRPDDIATLGAAPEEVIEAMESAPRRIGHWIGSDIPVPEAAVQLLRPNAILSRRYTNLRTGLSLDIVVVHCGDSRDMLGHYPPVCYPNSGWIRDDVVDRSGDRDIVSPRVMLESGGLAFAAHRFTFYRSAGWSQTRRIQILNFFVLPDGHITHDIGDVQQGARWLGSSIHGVAQFQIVADQAMPLDQLQAAANELLDGLNPLMNAMGVFSYE